MSESDAHRWETTENGPEKLYAIVAHDKYSWPLREEAALSLIRMRPRNGKRIGLEYAILGYDTPEGKGPGALAVLGDDARRRIVDGIAPKLIEQMQQPPPPPPAEGAVVQPDPSIPYKDGAFALLSHEPPLASNEATKASLIAALTQWVQTDFEDRIDNSNQQFGVEQIMRFLGAPSVKTLPSYINETSTKVDRACSLVADIGDDDTKRRASDALVTVGKHIASTDWVEKQRALVVEANQKAKISATPQQVSDQLKQYQDQELEKVFTNMKRVGGRPAVDYCLALRARQGQQREEPDQRARGHREPRRQERARRREHHPRHPRPTTRTRTRSARSRWPAWASCPKDMILPKLYALFDKKWQVRLDAARMILKTITTKDVPDFMRTSAAERQDEDGSERADRLRGAHHGHGPAGGPEAARRAGAVPPGGRPRRQADGARLLLRWKKIRCGRSAAVRGGPRAGAQVRPRRPVRMAVRRAESAWIPGQRDEDRHHGRRIRPMVHRAVAAVMRRAARWANDSRSVSLGPRRSGRGRSGPSFAAKGNGDKR